ncbi:DUF5333 domain-containing protein [Phaeobacter sp. 11ANDIMAR09]|uniref:DUF5333 domain-containing protein n=1 Tax=Phaeobacter sp. 11ANDIMAR09 TaxID=1225647 RepID=UPI0006C8C398|nr:DUF5333 domain-containing protein [Phaeobacter sp. 11ANDIMAR09]KPD12549.1 hypothetical protein AN476_10075 [Phaeobacter sp. 11ANDIMAR09]
MRLAQVPSAVFAALTVTVLAVPTGLAAKPSLRDIPEIEEPLFAVAMAKEVADHCDSLGARLFKGIGELRRLRSHANSLGYADSEIRAYIESDTEKARMRARGEKLLAKSGVSYENPETFCTFGRAEIQKNSAIGALLRAK